MDEDRRTGTVPPVTPPPPPPAARPPLRRDRNRGLLGGVAAGLAHHLDVDVVLVRVAFVVGALLTQGLGVLAYVLCWVFIPAAPSDTTSADRADERSIDGRGAAFWVGIGLLGLGVLWFLGAMPWSGLLGWGWIDAGVLVPLLLIGLGVALWRTSGQQPPQPAAAAPTDPTAPAPPAAPVPPTSRPRSETMMPTTTTPRPTADEPQRPRAEDVHDGSADTVRRDAPGPEADAPVREGDAPPPPPPPAAPGGSGEGFTPPPVPSKPRSLLTRLTLGVALVTVGVLWTLEITTTLALGPLRILAIGLAVIGAGLLVGSVIGRGRPLIIVGVILLPLVLAGTVLRGLPAGQLVDTTFGGTAVVGEQAEQPLTIAELDPSYSLGAGRFELDLRELELEEDAQTLVEVGAGEVTVIVPPEVNVDVSASLGGGDLQVFDQRRTGLGIDLQVFDPAPIDDPESAPTLTLRVNGGFGDLVVRR